MPGMDGLTVQRELIRRGFSAPVIVTTAFSDHPSVEKALQNGALRVISKPFRPRELIDAIASVVNPLK
jgi:FixJ family two-component response regulator